jgi:hypothetical protein
MATPLFTVEIGLASAVDALTLDSSTKGRLSPATAPDVALGLGDTLGYSWVSITDYVLEGLTFRRGATRAQGPFWRYEAGTATFEVDNLDGRFDPLNLSSPYVTAGVTELRPSLPVRICANVNGAVEPVWVGVLDSIDLDYNSVTWSTARFSCVDGTERLQAADLPEIQPPVGAGDTVAARIARILDRIGWPAAARDLDATTGNTLQASTLAAAAWADIQLAADSDAGYLWIDRNGRIVYRTRGYVPTTPSLTFSSDSTVSGLDFTSVDITRDVAQVFNSISLARAGSTQTTVQDVVSQALLGQVRGYSRSDLICETDSQLADVSSWILANFSSIITRIEQVKLSPPADTDLLATGYWLALVRLELGDVVRVAHRTPDGRTITVDAIVRGLAWSAGVRSFDLTLSLQTQNPQVGTFILDDLANGVLDEDVLAVPAAVR